MVKYGCENWTIKKAECWRLNAFELWCWRRLLRVPWTARRSNQSILKEISPEFSLVGLIFKLQLQYFGHLMQRADSFEKTLMLRKIEGRRRRWQRMRWLDGITNSNNMGLGGLQELDGQGSLACCGSWGSEKVRHDWATELNLGKSERKIFRNMKLYLLIIELQSIIKETFGIYQPMSLLGKCFTVCISLVCLF